jgi:hypothetical protein
MIVPVFVAKMHGAVYTDQLLTGEQHRARSKLKPPFAMTLWGDRLCFRWINFLLLISLPTVVAAFLIASQVAGGGAVSHPVHVQTPGE